MLTLPPFSIAVFSAISFHISKADRSHNCDGSLATDSREPSRAVLAYTSRKKFVKFDQKFIQKINILHWQTEDKGEGKTLNGHHQVYMGKMDHESGLTSNLFL